jgi:hypothetical protein
MSMVPTPPATTIALLMASSLCWVAGAPAGVSAQAQERIFITVHDSTGAPVTDLTPNDFLIRIDGVNRELVSARRAETPPSIVILTDQLGLTSSYPLTDLREGLATFVRTIREASPEARFALLTMDGSPRVRARFDAAPSVIDRELARLVGVAPNSVMLDGVHQASEILARAPTERRAILNVFAAYRPDASSLRTDEVGGMLRQSGGSLWSVEVVAPTGWQSSQGPNRPSAANPAAGLGDPLQVTAAPGPSSSSGAYASMPREVVIAEGGVRSGGLRQTVTSRQQLAPALARVAELLLAQYEIVYGAGAATAKSERLVAVRRANVGVLAPSWVRR